jgi:hypothetical protein
MSDSRKWEWWVNGRRRSRTICVRLYRAELSIAHRCIGSDGCMSELQTFTCDAEHLPKLVHALTHALAEARKDKLL